MVRRSLALLMALTFVACAASAVPPTAQPTVAASERIGGTKTMRTYDAGHTLDATANADALTWITGRWRLSRP